MSFSFHFPPFVAVALFLATPGIARSRSDSSKNLPDPAPCKTVHGSNKETDPVNPPAPTSKESQEISLLKIHQAPQATGNAALEPISRDTAADQIKGASIQDLFGSDFLDDAKNFITTFSRAPLTPQRTSSQYRPEGTFTLLLNDGTPFSWGELLPSASIEAPRLPAGRCIVSMTTSRFAVAALLDDGSLISWGKDQSSLASCMQAPSIPTGAKVISIASTPTAFAALLDNGKILTWGNMFYGGQAPEIPVGKKAIALFSNGWAFTALLNDQKTTLSWGSPRCGGAGLIAANNPVSQIVSTDTAFAVLTIEGQVQAWGDAARGGVSPDFSSNPASALIPNEVAIAAMLRDGTLFCWGDATGGGTTPTIPPIVTTTEQPTPDPITIVNDDGSETTEQPPTPDPIITITPRTVASVVGNERAFAALLNDGTLMAWGDPGCGGVAPALADGKIFTSLLASQKGFSAFFEGGVLFWSQSLPQGVIVSLPASPVMMATTSEAAAAFFPDGSLQCWGVANCGGTTPFLEKRVMELASNDHAFVALLEDGTVQTWGEGLSSVKPVLPEHRKAFSIASPFFKETLHLQDELSGIVVVNNSTTTQGQWQYATAWSEDWKTIPQVNSGASGFALDVTTRLRFLPAPDFSGAPPPLMVKLLDATVEVNDGDSLNVMAPDAAAPYSAATISLTTIVTESFWEKLLGR